MAKGTRISALRQAKLNNRVGKPFNYNGKKYREVDDEIHTVGNNDYIQLEFEYKGEWHLMKNVTIMCNIYKQRHG